MIRPTIDAIETRHALQERQQNRHRYFSPVEETHYRPRPGQGVRIVAAIVQLIAVAVCLGVFVFSMASCAAILAIQ